MDRKQLWGRGLGGGQESKTQQRERRRETMEKRWKKMEKREKKEENGEWKEENERRGRKQVKHTEHKLINNVDNPHEIKSLR